MLYNIKMRSSKGGPHEKGGKHISGAERILREDEIEDEIIRMYPRQKPIYLFGVLYYNLKDMDSENSLDKEFDYLKEFIDCKIDLFMIVNFMR